MAKRLLTAATVAKTNNNIKNNLEKNTMNNPTLKPASAMTPVSEITRTRKSMMATTTVAIPNRSLFFGGFMKHIILYILLM